MAAEGLYRFKLELDRYLEVLEIEGYRDVDKTFRYLKHSWVIVCVCTECCLWGCHQEVVF